MEYQTIPAQVGTQLLLQLRQLSNRVPSKLVGLEHGRYLIVTIPALPLSDVKTYFTQGKAVVVRYIHEGTALGFESVVMGIIIQPVRLVFLKYPQKVQDANLRKHRRCDCYLPAELEAGSKSIPGVILDISVGGGCFHCKQNEQYNVDSPNVGDTVQLRFGVPGVEGKLDVVSTVRNIRTDDDGIFFGLQFMEVSDDRKQVLMTYLNEMQLLEGGD